MALVRMDNSKVFIIDEEGNICPKDDEYNRDSNFHDYIATRLIIENPNLKEEFENCGVKRPSLFLVLKGYLLGTEYLDTNKKKILYLSLAITEKTKKVLKECEEKGYDIIDDFKTEFYNNERDKINKLLQKDEDGKGRQRALDYVKNKFFHWDEKEREKYNYRLKAEYDDLEL